MFCWSHLRELVRLYETYRNDGADCLRATPLLNIGVAKLRVEHDGEISTVVDQFSQTPLQLHRPLYLEEASYPTVYLKTPSSGLLDGDVHEIEVSLGVNSRLELRTQAATLAYPGESSLDIKIHVGDGGKLVYLPHAMILGEGARLTQRVCIKLEGTASIDYSDTWCAGRIAMREQWKFSFYDYHLEIFKDDVFAYRERWRINPSVDGLSNAFLCGDYTHFASIYSFGPSVDCDLELPSPPAWEVGEDWTLTRDAGTIRRRCSRVEL
jgi:urease accessory protein